MCCGGLGTFSAVFVSYNSELWTELVGVEVGCRVCLS